jgi:hypothetical protein
MMTAREGQNRQRGVMTAAEGAITDRLGRGDAIPFGPGACYRPGCWHAKVWHSVLNRRHPCELCDCERCADWEGASGLSPVKASAPVVELALFSLEEVS